MGFKTFLKRGWQYARKGVPNQITYVPVSQIQYGGGLLKDRCIIVTGATRGLGFEIARRAIEEGAQVMITGRNEETLLEAKNKMSDPSRCHIYVHDLKEIEKAFKVIAAAYECMGKADSLVNNAGVSVHDISYWSCTPEQYDLQMDTNLRGTYFMTQSFIKRFVNSKQEMGKILMMSSERGTYPDDVPYGLAKAALNSFTMGLSRKVIRNGIRVNAICPGVTATEFTGHDPDGNLYRKYAEGRRIHKVEEVAELAIFLLSDAANGISGQIIAVNEANKYLQSGLE